MENEFTSMTDEELLAEAKKMRSNAVLNAFLIGFAVGVFVYGIAVNGFGFLGLIPLYLAYRIANNPDSKARQDALKATLRARNLN